MKTIVAITLIVVGAVLIAAPVAAIVIESSTYQSNLVAYFERHGRGSAYDNPPCCPPRHSAVFCASSRQLGSAPADIGWIRNVRTGWFRVTRRCVRPF